ncbi:MAG: hypothetical protein HY943_04995 [Gammaproteobacteria bacterium]|nr:hypothetical protein [Gammaproteobacteria bacterium]
MSALRAIAGRLAGAAAFLFAFIAGSFVVPLFARWSVPGRVMAIALVAVVALVLWRIASARAPDEA